MASPGSDSTAAAAAAPAADAGAGLSVTAPRVVHNLGEWSARERHQARRLMAVFVLVALFFGVELAGATMANSDVLRIDALHLLTDVGALAMALMAMRLAVRRPTVRFTFGWRRAEPVAAIFNAGLVLAATLVLILEAVKDMRGTGSPRADIMLYVASGALVVNGISAWLIHDALHAVHALPEPGAHDHAHHHEHDHNHGHDHHEAHAHEHKAHAHKADAHAHGHGHAHGHSLNLRGAWLHLLGDALGSLAALVAAVLIRLGFSPKVDPCASLVVAAILIVGAVRLLRDAGLILLEAAPRHLPVGGVESAILSVSGVAGIHELHIWTLGAGHDAITAHVLAEGEDPSVGMRVESAIRKRFQVEYVTVQIETEAALCQGIPLKSRVGT